MHVTLRRSIGVSFSVAFVLTRIPLELSTMPPRRWASYVRSGSVIAVFCGQRASSRAKQPGKPAGTVQNGTGLRASLFTGSLVVLIWVLRVMGKRLHRNGFLGPRPLNICQAPACLDQGGKKAGLPHPERTGLQLVQSAAPKSLARTRQFHGQRGKLQL